MKRSLVAHQEKSATTEMSMMDAILQMKEQIQQVYSLQQKPRLTDPEEPKLDKGTTETASNTLANSK